MVQMVGLVRKGDFMFQIYDTKAKCYCGRPNEIRVNAIRKCQVANVNICGIDELDKPEEKRRFVVHDLSRFRK